MAVPKRRISRARRGNRRKHQKLAVAQLTRCDTCGAAVRPHHVCNACGHYRGRQVIIGETAT